METTANFEQALREGYRYASTQGSLTTEDVYRLPLEITDYERSKGKTCLNDVAKGIFTELKSTAEVNFVSEVSTGDALLQAKLDIVKHIIAVKKAEAKAKTDAKSVKAQKDQLAELIVNKKNEALAGKTTEELQALYDQLG